MYCNKTLLGILLGFFVIVIVAQGMNNKCELKPPEQKDGTTLRITDNALTNSNYKWHINFRIVNTTCKKVQRCNLLAWENIRNLQKYLSHSAAVHNGTIWINNSMLQPGVEYFFNVTITNMNKTVENKILTLKSFGGKPSGNSLASVKLLGSNEAYPDFVYISYAEIVLCEENGNYFCKWDLLDGSQNLAMSFPTRGSELEITAHNFRAGNSLYIRCTVVNSQSNETIGSALQIVNVLERKKELYVPLKNLSVGTRSPITIEAFAIPSEENKDLEVHWECLYNSTSNCTGFENISTSKLLVFDQGFSKSGLYTINVETNQTIKRTCTIEIQGTVLPTIQIKVPKPVINPLVDEIVVNAHIGHLTAGCTMQWTCVRGEEFLNSNESIGNFDEIFTVILKEDVFLEELQEFSNSTTEADYNLNIPSPKDDWKGLKANHSFLFRLNVTCPSNVADYEDQINTTATELEPVLDLRVAYADVEVQTFPSPLLEQLVVTPKEGVALQTVFNYSLRVFSEEAPLVYKFGFVLGNETVFFRKLFGVPEVQTTLPFNDGRLETVAEICNTFDVCSRKSGTVLQMALPDDIASNKKQFLKIFSSNMYREEYHSGIVYAINLLNVYKYLSDESFSEVKSAIFAIVDKESKKWANFSNDSMENVAIKKNFPRGLDDFSEKLNNNLITANSTVNSTGNFLPGRKLTMTDDGFGDKNTSKLSPEANNITVDITNIETTEEIQPFTQIITVILVACSIVGLLLMVFIVKKLVSDDDTDDHELFTTLPPDEVYDSSSGFM